MQTLFRYCKKGQQGIFLIVTLLSTLSSTCFAQEKVDIEDRIIGSTFKTLAKAYILTVDMDTLKKDNIDKLNKMDEEKFRKRYAQVYEIIKDFPVKLKVNYGVDEAMPKEQVIKNIESLDKKKIYDTIDSIPDIIIAKQFKQYLNKKKQEIQKSNAVEQINKFWNKIMKKVNMPVRPHSEGAV